MVDIAFKVDLASDSLYTTNSYQRPPLKDSSNRNKTPSEAPSHSEDKDSLPAPIT